MYHTKKGNPAKDMLPGYMQSKTEAIRKLIKDEIKNRVDWHQKEQSWILKIC